MPVKTIDELLDKALLGQAAVHAARQDYDDWAAGKRPDLIGQKAWKELEAATKTHLTTLRDLQEAKHADHIAKLPRKGELAQVQAMLQRAGVLYKFEENSGPSPRTVQIIVEGGGGMAAAVLTFNGDGTLANFEVCT